MLDIFRPRQNKLPTTLTSLLGSALLFSLCAISAPVSYGQDAAEATKTVHLLQEPRYRTVLRDGGVILLDIQINPGDETYPHTHNQAILLTHIADENGPLDGEVESQTEYINRPLTHVVKNQGKNMIRTIAMVNDNPPVANDQDDTPTGISQQPVLENRWFRSYRIELQPGESTGSLTHQNAVAIILASGELLHVSREDGITDELEQAGDWAWRHAGSPYQITNTGNAPCTVVVNESRRKQN